MDLRPDIVFVVSGAVWLDYEALRDRWDHPLCIGLRDECIDRIRQAMKDGANDQAAHWKAVGDLARQYGTSWVSAVEVDGKLFRETPKLEPLIYPADDRLERILIGDGLDEGNADGDQR